MMSAHSSVLEERPPLVLVNRVEFQWSYALAQLFRTVYRTLTLNNIDSRVRVETTYNMKECQNRLRCARSVKPGPTQLASR